MTKTDLRPTEPDTRRVSISVLISGKKIPREIHLHSVIVQTEVNSIPSALISIRDGEAASGEWSASEDTYFIPGNEIEISVGYQGIEESIFKGIVTRNSLRVRQAQRELYIECRDRSILMTIARNSRLFANVKDSDIASALLGAYGLSGTIEDTPVTHAEITQYDCSDWDFLISRMDATGYVSFVDKGKVSIIKPGIESTASATIRYGSNVIEFDADIDGSSQYGRVTAKSWNPSD
jgi:phage protein D